VAPDLEFFFDVVCPFSWQTSRWVEEVRRQRPIEVIWRPVSLAMLNEDEDPASPMGRLHERGLQLQRVMAAAADAHGGHKLGALYTTVGQRIWDTEPPAASGFDAVADAIADDVENGELDVAAALRDAKLPDSMDEAQGQADARWDAILRTNSNEAVARAGGDVGTPVLSFDPPDGPAFFGPVISRPPLGEDAVAVWEAVTTLARVDGFAEFKLQQKAMPEVRLLGNV
jgi:2-hydroxychromene-2-carboxylate isomerase